MLDPIDMTLKFSAWLSKLLTVGTSLGWFSGMRGRVHLKPNLAHLPGQEEAEVRRKD